MIVASKSVRELVEVEFGTLTDPRPRWDSNASLIAPPTESVLLFVAKRVQKVSLAIFAELVFAVLL